MIKTLSSKTEIYHRGQHVLSLLLLRGQQLWPTILLITELWEGFDPQMRTGDTVNTVNNPGPWPAMQPKCPGVRLLCSPGGKSCNPKHKSVLHPPTASLTAQAQHFTELGHVYPQNAGLACSRRTASDHHCLPDSQRSRRSFHKVV